MPKNLLNAPSPAAQKLELLRELFPQAIETQSDGSVRVNAAAMQQALDPQNENGVRVEEDGYELRWVGKREAYHSAFVPTQKIVNPLEGDSKHWGNTGNLLIKGDNLDALKLLRHSYFGQIKLIYIDPPYNTQSDAFIYRDNFSTSQTQVLEQLGYSRDNIDYIKNIYSARTHSGWLSFMYPRLLLARDLLRDDGVIFISIDDNEQAQLKLLCDEVFGQENFFATLIRRAMHTVRNSSKDFNKHADYVLVYAKDKSWFEADSERFIRQVIDKTDRYPNDDGDGRGLYKYDPLHARNFFTPYEFVFQNGVKWTPPAGRYPAYSKKTLSALEADGRIDFSVSEPRLKRYLNEVQIGQPPNTILAAEDAGFNSEATAELHDVLGTDKVFSQPKPVRLIKHLMSLLRDSNATVLDFFAGSGTTAEAVMRLNAEDGGSRKFILVQIPQAIDPKKQKEAHSFVKETLGKAEATIFEITAERLRRAGAKLAADKPDATGLDTGFRVFELVDDPDALILQKPLAEATQADVAALQALIATPQPAQLPRVLYNLLLTEGLPLSTVLEPVLALQYPNGLFRAADVLMILQAVDTEDLRQALADLKAAGTPIQHLSVYAPWVHDDNFLLGTKTLLETLGLSDDKLRLRG